MRRRLSSATAIAAAAVAALAVTPANANLPEQAADQAAAHTHGPDPKDLDRRGRVVAAPYDVDAHAPWSATEYDGTVATTDQADAADLQGLPMVHAVYIYPSDRASRFSQFAAMFQADARQASGLLAALYGRGIRFDERVTADGTTRYLDITSFRSKYNYKRLSGGSQFNLVRDELRARGFTDPNKKYVAWLDAGSQYCGQGELYQDARRGPENYNERRTTSIVYRPYSPSDPLTGGFCRGRTLLHEIGHNLGALQDDAPNDFDGAHCADSAEDVMCYTSRTSNDTGGPEFDWNNDDYWDLRENPTPDAGTAAPQKLGWWTVNLSKYVCPLTGCASPASPQY